jgi:ubiquinone/menaquinone biosynthesis C-methylase UbiE
MELTKRHKDRGVSPTDSTRKHSESFNEQAGFFEQRAGLPESCCRDVAKKVIEIGKVGRSDLVVEVGAGTGQIGRWFDGSVRYAGFDVSSEMLEHFSSRLHSDASSRLLIQADANARWPFADGVARVIFSSRVMHLLEQEHVSHELLRVSSPNGATLIFGRVERKPDNVKSRMAKEMNERLQLHGFTGRRSEREHRKVFETCSRVGAIGPQSLTVAKWTTSASPRQSLDSWHSHTTLGGITVPAETRRDVLREVEVWAEEVFGELDREFESEESYVLNFLTLSKTRDE